MRILFLAPTQIEFEHLQETLKKADLNSSHQYQTAWLGLGLVDAAINAMNLIVKGKPDIVVLTGYVGAKGDFKQGQMVMPSFVRRWDIMVPCIDLFESYYSILSLITDNSSYLTLFSGDMFATEQAEKNLNLISPHDEIIPENCIFDMEAFSVAKACDSLNKPLLVVKYVSDVIDEPDHQLNSFFKYVNEQTYFPGLIEKVNELCS